MKATNELVAIKFINKEELIGDELKRFEREIRIHNQLNHQNIIGIIDYYITSEDSKPYYVMPIAEKNFSTFLREYREDNYAPMDDEIATMYFNQLLDGVEYAHSEGIIHRDLNPRNILVFNNGNTIKISDFGFGKRLNSDSESLTLTGTGVGTDIYSAPEQLHEGNAKEVDERADIYSLGKILYEMVTGDLPYIIDAERIKSSRFSYIINRATRHNKEDRYKSVSKLKEDLEYLVIKSKYLNEDPSAKFNELLDEYYRTSEIKILEDILDLFLAYHDSESLFESRFFLLEENIFKIMYNEYKDKLLTNVENYLYHTRGYHAFSSTDYIADTLEKIYSVISSDGNDELREKILIRLCGLGYDHNRFHVGGIVFARVASKMTTGNDILLLISVLEANIAASSWNKTYLFEYTLPSRITEFLKTI